MSYPVLPQIQHLSFAQPTQALLRSDAIAGLNDKNDEMLVAVAAVTVLVETE